jgi:hypothetical protein
MTPAFLRRAIAESEEDFLKLWVHYYGPERIVAWAAEHNPQINWEGRYAHRCQFCHRMYRDNAIRDVIREHWKEMIAQVLQTAWLDEVYAPAILTKLMQENMAH